MTYNASKPTSVDLSNTLFLFLINDMFGYEHESIELNTHKTTKAQNDYDRDVSSFTCFQLAKAKKKCIKQLTP